MSKINTPGNLSAESEPDAIPPGQDPSAESVSLVQPGEREFTIRAVVTGALLGALFSTCNIYIGLKFGWGLNLSILAALVGYGVWQTGSVAFGTARFGILENNISQTACSAGASVAGAGLIAAIPAVMLLDPNFRLPWWQLSVWIFSVCLVGILMAMPVRRQLIEVEKLPFATGVATAEMLKEIYSKSTDTALRLVYLSTAAVLAGIHKVGTDVFNWSALQPFSLRGQIRGISVSSLGFQLSSDPVGLGLGGLIGIRIAFSLLLGGLIGWAVVAPALVINGVVKVPVSEPLAALPVAILLPEGVRYDEASAALQFTGIMSEQTRDALLAASEDGDFRTAASRMFLRSQQGGPAPVFEAQTLERAAVPYGLLLRWLIWPATAMIVVGSLVTLVVSLIAVPFRGRTSADGTMGRPLRMELTTPFWVLLAIVLVLSPWLQHALFGIDWWAGILAVGLSFALAIVAGRVVGETAINPAGPLGKFTQLTFGVLKPTNPSTNLMTASVTCGAASQCADLLYDLKCGQMIGASPNKQLAAQICGVFGGSLAGCAIFLVLMADPNIQLMTEKWPAPAVASWKAFAEVFARQTNPLPDYAVPAMIWAAVAAVALTLLERWVPQRGRAWVPSATSIGMGAIIGMSLDTTIFAGALLMWTLARVLPGMGARLALIFCVGLIAGESITGVGLAFAQIDWKLASSWFR